MRALFVAPYLPTPGSGGRTRLINFMERLGRRHELALVAFAARDQEQRSELPGVVLPPPPVRARPGGLKGAARFYRERAEPFPAFVSQMTSSELVRAIGQTCVDFKPDVVQIETTEMAQYLAAVPRGRARALDLQDVASRWFGRVAREGSTRKQRGLMTLELLKTRRYEVRHARMADAVMVTSDVERAHLHGLTGVDPVVVPNGVDTAAFAPAPEIAEQPNHVLFVGPLTYDANLIGLRWFAERVLPKLEGVTVDHVGETGGHAFEGVTSHGRVPDVRPFLARAPVSIVPVRVGSGTRYKILEALSMARAVVSTTVGAEGLGVRDDEHVLLADEPEDFARAIARLLADPPLRARLGAAGRTHVVERYDWEPLVERVESVWDVARGRASTKYE